jgi:hypothetical protein
MKSYSNLAASLIFPVGVIMGVYGFVLSRMGEVALSDPDRYFHVAIFKMGAESGLVTSLPQAADLGWAEAFPNGYFLFGLFGAALYRLGGESSAQTLAPILAILFFSILLFALRKRLDPWQSLGLCLLLLFTPEFSNRLVLLRPHLLAMAEIVLLVLGILLSNPVLCAVASALFALSYHAFYVPLLLLGVALGIRLLSKEPGPYKVPVAGFLGLCLGTLINPYFPLNLEMGVAGILASFNTAEIRADDLAVETKVKPLGRLIAAFGFYYAVSIAATIFLVHRLFTGKKSKNSLSANGRLAFLAVSAIIFLTLTLISNRAAEYAIPLSILLAGEFLREAGESSRYRSAIWCVALVTVAVPGFVFYSTPTDPILDPSARLNAVAAIPPEPGKKVFNAEWSTGSFILYQRPDLRFVDLADPLALALKAPVKSALRDQLHQGHISYPLGLVKFAFGADYVATEDPGLVAQLEADPGFARIHPVGFSGSNTRRAGSLFVYGQNQRFNWGYHFEVTPLVRMSDSASRVLASDSDWRALKSSSALPDDQRSPVVNLMGSGAQETGLVKKGEAICTWVRPTADELQKFRGMDIVGLGGAGKVRLWSNGKLVFSEAEARPMPRPLHHFAKLSNPISSSSKLEALVCSPGALSPLYFALSFWNSETLRAECAGRVSEKDSDAFTPKSGRETVIHYVAKSWCQTARQDLVF